MWIWKSPNVCEPHYTTVGQWNVVTKSNLDYLKEALKKEGEVKLICIFMWFVEKIVSCMTVAGSSGGFSSTAKDVLECDINWKS